MTKKRIEFWFDFSSAYAYFASLQIEELATRHNRDILWRPFMIGEAFRVTGAQRLTSTPLKGEYAVRDWQRLARLTNRSFSLPSHHPSIALPAVRACHWLEDEMPHRLGAFATAVFRAYFEDGIDTACVDSIAEVAHGLDIPTAGIIAANCDMRLKQAAQDRSREAVALGIFGSPWIVVDDEPFWGCDRLPSVDLWLQRGGW